MALSKIGLRKRQEKGKACFNVGLNFPEKHAMHLKSYLQCIIFYSVEFFLIVSTKVKTLKSLLTITDGLTDRKTRCVHIILQPPTHRHSSDWSSNKTLQDFFNTPSFVVGPPDKYCYLEENKTLLLFIIINFTNSV